MKARNAELRLMKRVATREREAAKELFDRYADEVFAFVSRRLPDADRVCHGRDYAIPGGVSSPLASPYLRLTQIDTRFWPMS